MKTDEMIAPRVAFGDALVLFDLFDNLLLDRLARNRSYLFSQRIR